MAVWADGRRDWRVVLLTAVLVGSIVVVAAPRPAQAATGGPDTYGYIWVDSRSPSPTFPYSWVDIVSRGSKLALGNDQCTYEVSLGFQFRFYNTIWNEIFVCSNGFITFGVPDGFYPDGIIPDDRPPNSRIVGLGWDLDPSNPSSGGIYIYGDASTTPQRFIITWDRVYTDGSPPRPNPPVPETFQIILEQNETTKDGRIILQYRSVGALPSMPLIGIENAPENPTGYSGLAYPNPITNNLAVAFLPPSDQGLPPEELRVSFFPLAPTNVPQGAANVGMVRIDLSTTTNEIFVTRIRVNLTGVGNLASDVPSARLWLDGGDGDFTPPPGPTDDTLLDGVDVTGIPPSFTFEPGSPLRVATGFSRRVFVAYNIASTATPDDWIGAGFPSEVAVSVMYPDTVSPTNFPFDTYLPGTRTQIEQSQDTLLLTKVGPRAPANVSQWQTDVPAFNLTLDADRNFVAVSGLRVALGGNATAADAWAVKLVRDTDDDGNFTLGVDEILGIQAATDTPSPPHATFLFNLTVKSGTPEHFLVYFDVAPNATVGHVFDLTVNDTDVFLPSGSVDIISAANYPASSGPANLTAGVRPALQLPWVNPGPVADRIWMDQEYLLGPDHTVPLDRPIGNLVPGYMTVQNNRTHLFVAVDPIHDLGTDPANGVAIGFDTDGNGTPTPGGDDVFLVNETGGLRLQYNASASDWTPVSACLPYAGNASNATCAAGAGPTAFGRYPHRSYEFSIPLTLLNVTVPIVPGSTIRFALGSAPYCGVADGGNRSTWPLLFCPAPAPLADFGDLVLATGFTPNRPPVLNWTGEPGYTDDAVEPEAAPENATFLWRVTYIDEDNDPPAVGQPLLRVSRDGSEIPGSPYTMVPDSARPTNYRTGKIFLYPLTDLPCGGAYSYFITVEDARGLSNSTAVRPGPQVVCPNRPPALSSPSVANLTGEAGSLFTYRITYSDEENETPLDVRVFIWRGGADVGNYSLGLVRWIGDFGDYIAGASYQVSVRLQQPGFNYTYRFHAANANGSADTETFFGPYVLVPPPDVVTVAGLDKVTSLEVDAGQRMVPLLNLWFIMPGSSRPGSDVNVTQLRVDQIGTATDAEVERIVLYKDEDRDGALTAGDRFLGAIRPLPLGPDHAVVFAFNPPLRVLPPPPNNRSVSLLLFVNVSAAATADATIRLEVRNSTYVSVGPGDFVQPFLPLRSTRVYVNLPPSARDPTVNGFPDGSPGIRHILGAGTPTLGWQFTDPNAGDFAQVAYDVSVSNVTPPGVVWSENGGGSGTSTVYGGPTLTLGASYLLQVRVFDGRLWSAPAVALFRVNTPPPAPGLFSPPDGASGIPANTTLLWNPVSDNEVDPVTYFHWISDDIAFANPMFGSSTSPGHDVSLAPGTTYYWKVAASDGWEVAGNATVWQFTTAANLPPVRGEVLGRVLNGTVPLPDAVILLFASGSFVDANVSGPDGRFAVRGLDLVPFTVRIEAEGFKSLTRTATPTNGTPVVDLGDIPLERVTQPPPNGGNPPAGLPAWVLPLIAVLMAVAVATSLLAAVALLRSRRGEAPEEAAPGREKPAKGARVAREGKARVREGRGAAHRLAQTAEAKPKARRTTAPEVAAAPVAAATIAGSADRLDVAPKPAEAVGTARESAAMGRIASPDRPAAAKPPGPPQASALTPPTAAKEPAAARAVWASSDPTAAVVFECPECGRRVAADAQQCECGAIFEG